jgi:hypothetical protein
MVNQVSEQPTSKDLSTRLRAESRQWYDDDSSGLRLIAEAADEVERLQRENTALRNLADNLRPGPISEALAGSMADEYRRAGIEPCPDCDPYCHCFKPVESMDSDLVCGNCGKPFHEAQRASQPPSLLREVAAIAYDTSKAAEDRIRDIQDLWEGATATPPAEYTYTFAGNDIDGPLYRRTPTKSGDPK